MESLPDLSGQPAWVIILVVGLTAIGSVGGAILKTRDRPDRKRKRKRDRAIEQPAGVPSLPTGQVDVLHTSVTAIIEAGLRADKEADQARAETRAVRGRLELAMLERAEALRARDRAIADLDRCDATVLRLRAELNGDAP